MQGLIAQGLHDSGVLCRGLDVTAGDLIELAVEAEGDAPIEYAWMRDGWGLADHTGPVLIIPEASTADSGQYRCEASNAAGITASLPAFVVVRDTPTALCILQQPRWALSRLHSTLESL